MIGRRILPLILSFIVYGVAFAETAFQVGEISVALPAPSGYVQAGPNDRAYKAYEALTSPNSRLLAVFLPADTPANYSTIDRNFRVLTIRRRESTLLTSSDFSGYKELIREQHVKLLEAQKDKVENLIQNVSRKDIKISGLVHLGVIDETPYSITTGVISRVTEPGVPDEVHITSSTLMVQKGKLLQAFADSLYRGDADTQWIKTQTRLWLNQISSANK